MQLYFFINMACMSLKAALHAVFVRKLIGDKIRYICAYKPVPVRTTKICKSTFYYGK